MFVAPVSSLPPRRAAQSGFTLLEIMLVVVIIGIVVVGAILSLGVTGKDSGLEKERDRLTALIAYSRERGAMLTLEYGIRCGQHGYRFVFYDNRLMQWLPETVDDTLHARRLPDGLEFHLLVEGIPVVLDDKALQVNPHAATPPGGTVSYLGSSSGMSTITGNAGISGLSSGGSSGGFSSGLGGSGLGSTGFGGSSGLGSSAGGGSGSGSGYGSSGSHGAGSSGSGSSGSGSSGGGLNDQGNDNTPQVLLFSNGDTNTFALTLERAGVGRTATLQSSDDGSVHTGDILEAKQ
jgi:prepilin-type N-terminal cleavage/methylation domain-containing protein